MVLRRIAILITALLSVCLCTAGGAQVRYRIIDLGELPTMFEFFPVRITESSEIIGMANGNTSPFQVPFLWRPSTGMVPISTPPGAVPGSPVVRGISKKGIAGTSDTSGPTGPVFQASVWENPEHGRLLGPAPTFESDGNDISDAGDVIGQFDFLPAIWGKGGSLTFLPISPNNPYGDAIRINHRGEIAGYKYAENTSIRTAMVWDRFHHPTVIGTLFGGDTVPSDINDKGWVVGTTFIGFGLVQSAGFFWSRATGLTKLPGLGASPEVTYVEGINNRGQIVGSSISSNPAQSFTSGVIWQDGRITDLNTLIEQPEHGLFFLSTADGINDRGEICGFGNLFIDGEFLDHAFLLEPIRK